MIRQLRFPLLLVAAIALLLVSSAPAQADGFGYGCYSRCSPYPADLTPLYAVGAIPLPPYFAMHPPVYYDLPIARTYGYSPWAYPPEVMTPEIVEPTPKIIENKFVPKPVKQETEKPKMAVTPLRIVNPYVTNSESLPEAAIAAR